MMLNINIEYKVEERRAKRLREEQTYNSHRR